ncbi:Gibberellin 2-beta-dioxygenase 2 [Sesamum angolense]|uniref:Gibberellin 2-beta-dioxygenase 2 n=1 Tax=Sesamum angolense TaxID=2727404 RepID=A0AAE1X8V5_9LAMI|nr:Gibberellin 2-beta-dioxygenase 2 [Sesamum angolense]
MVVASPAPLRTKKARPAGIPVIDLSLERSKLCELLVKACEEFGVFQVENHGVSREIISRLEREGQEFFSKPACQKQRAGPAAPFGYGCKNIGFNGDKGELEYIILEANPHSVSERSKSISPRPANFSCAVNDYIDAVRTWHVTFLRCWLKGYGSKINPFLVTSSEIQIATHASGLITILHHSMLLIHMMLGLTLHPTCLIIITPNSNWLWRAFRPSDSHNLAIQQCDAFQAMSNGRFTSVRHRAVANSAKARMSMMYFAAPAPNASIAPIPQMVSCENPCLYRPFTWAEYKATAYSLRLADNRLDLFRN